MRKSLHCSVLLIFSVSISLISGQRQALLFEPCSLSLPCQFPAVCRQAVCMPREEPTPVFDFGSIPDNRDAQRAMEMLTDAVKETNRQIVEQQAQQASQLTTAAPSKVQINEAELQKALAQVLAQIQNRGQTTDISSLQTAAQQLLPFVTQTMRKVTVESPLPTARLALPSPPAPHRPSTPLSILPMTSVLSTAIPTSVPVPSTQMISMPIPLPQPTACQPKCVGNARCALSRCICLIPNIIYSPLYGCASTPFPSLPTHPSASIPPAPLPIFRPANVDPIRTTNMLLHPLPGFPDYQSARFVAPMPPPKNPALNGIRIAQGAPGDLCSALVVECTGGSQCSLGVCTCPPELVQEGQVCVMKMPLPTQQQYAAFGQLPYLP